MNKMDLVFGQEKIQQIYREYLKEFSIFSTFTNSIGIVHGGNGNVCNLEAFSDDDGVNSLAKWEENSFGEMNLIENRGNKIVPMKEQLEDSYDELLFADGFDDAITGVIDSQNGPIVVYNREQCIKILEFRDGMDWEEAEEFFSFNVDGAYVGPQTPVYMTTPTTEFSF